MHKLGVIVPYRNRYEQLQQFRQSISSYLKYKGIPFELIIVEQDNAKEFNRGKLLNIGFIYAKKLECDYIALHDVDMLPVDVDYSYTDIPTHLASNFVSKDSTFKRIVFDEYFGGVTLFPIETFEDINGYSNEYWGWGYEDDDLLYRCKKRRISLDSIEVKTYYPNNKALKFNGTNSYVVGKNTINVKEDLSIFISFYPDDLVCNHTKFNDIFTLFSIPGYDFRITYNGFRRYALEIFNSNNELLYISTDIIPNYKTNIVVTIDTKLKMISMYQNGKIVGYTSYNGELYDYNSQPNFYIGCGNIYVGKKEDESYYKGLLDIFAVYNCVLSSDEVAEISTISDNGYPILSDNFGNYNASASLIIYYDVKESDKTKLYDVSGNRNIGIIHNCDIVNYRVKDTKSFAIPYRRNCTFELLPHSENGYVGNAWKTITTRYNQLRFYNEVMTGNRNLKDDGLSTCKFKEHGCKTVENETHIVVAV